MRIRLGLLKGAVALLGCWAMAGCGGSVATIEFVDVQPAHPRLGEVATVSFNLTDYRGVALAGQSVTLALLDGDKPGITLTPKSAVSQKTGLVQAQIVVTNRVTSVVVVATSGDKSARSGPISFLGSNASGRQMTFQCGQIAGAASGGRHAIGAYDQSRYLIAGVKLNCTAHVADRNGDGIAGTAVGFLTEAGAIGPTETSIADIVGNAQILYKTSYPLPQEVETGVFTWNPPLDDIHTGQYLVPLWMEPYNWTSNPIGTVTLNMPAYNMNNLLEPRRIDPIRKRPDGSKYENNPRDNLVSMIAFTSGEEGFTDVDNDGKFTEGVDVFDKDHDDLTEPFVDNNDNGTWDDGEKYVDTNGNKKWDGKDGVWNATTNIWAQERILWTGIPADQDFTNLNGTIPVFRAVQASGGAPILVGCESGVAASFLISDPWFNSLAQNGDGDGCSSVGGKAIKITGGVKGTVFTYPALTEVGFFIEDALDREPVPMTVPSNPGCFPPPKAPLKDFAGVMTCTFTASPIEGHKVLIGIPFGGTIINNKQ